VQGEDGDVSKVLFSDRHKSRVRVIRKSAAEASKALQEKRAARLEVRACMRV
jgi:hypothetical protein